jgi:hypothetical protein
MAQSQTHSRALRASSCEWIRAFNLWAAGWPDLHSRDQWSGYQSADQAIGESEGTIGLFAEIGLFSEDFSAPITLHDPNASEEGSELWPLDLI